MNADSPPTKTVDISRESVEALAKQFESDRDYVVSDTLRAMQRELDLLRKLAARSSGEPACGTCNDTGAIGGFDHGEAAFRTEPCPECFAPDLFHALRCCAESPGSRFDIPSALAKELLERLALEPAAVSAEWKRRFDALLKIVPEVPRG